MTCCISIISRLNSQRLRNKALIKVKKKPILSYLVNRINNEFSNDIKSGYLEVFILTGSKKLNKKIELIKKYSQTKIHYGNEKNIPLRILNFVNKKKFDFILVVDGDDILCSVEGMRKLVNYMNKSKDVFVKTRGYPFGMNSLALKTKFIKSCKNIKKYKIMDTGWTRLFEDKKKIKFIDKVYKKSKKLRFTLDYKEDLTFFRSIINSNTNIVKAKDQKIISGVFKNKFYKHNFKVIKKYWENFYKKKN